MNQLTMRQQEVLKIIYEGIKSGLPPSFVELRERLSVSSNQTVRDLLDALARKGYIIRKPRRARAIMLSEKAYREMSKNENSLGSEQLEMGFNFITSTCWNGYGNNIGVIEGRMDLFPKELWDNSQSIKLAETDYSGFDRNDVLVQPIIDSTNWGCLQEVTKRFLKNFNPLVVDFRKNIDDLGPGYTILNDHPAYLVVWSGMFDSHYFFRGRENGSNNTVYSLNVNSGQLSLFPSLIDSSQECIYKLRRELKSFSQWIDFPIYGGLLKKSGDILFWSHSTASDSSDLRNLLLVDATGMVFRSHDVKLFRDIKYNFQINKILNSSTV